MICPDLKPGEGLVLEGEPASMIQKNFQFSIKKCNPKLRKQGDLPCKSDAEIEEWIKDFQVDSWSVEQSINFEIYDEKPVYEVMKLQESWILQPDRTINIMLNMRLHMIEAMDNMLFVDIPSYEGTFF